MRPNRHLLQCLIPGRRRQYGYSFLGWPSQRLLHICIRPPIFQDKCGRLRDRVREIASRGPALLISVDGVLALRYYNSWTGFGLGEGPPAVSTPQRTLLKIVEFCYLLSPRRAGRKGPFPWCVRSGDQEGGKGVHAVEPLNRSIFPLKCPLRTLLLYIHAQFRHIPTTGRFLHPLTPSNFLLSRAKARMFLVLKSGELEAVRTIG